MQFQIYDVHPCAALYFCAALLCQLPCLKHFPIQILFLDVFQKYSPSGHSHLLTLHVELGSGFSLPLLFLPQGKLYTKESWLLGLAFW